MTARVQWTWRMALPMPWGASLEPQVRPLQLLELPLAFTQNELLSPDEFVKRAGERGVQLRAEHLLELHRRRALVPLLRITLRPPKSSEVVAVPATAADAYHQFRSPITAAHTYRQRVERAFAAELLAPAEGIAQLLESPPEAASQEEPEQIAQRYGVSSMVIEHQLRNHLLAPAA